MLNSNCCSIYQDLCLILSLNFLFNCKYVSFIFIKKKTSQRLELDNCIPRNYNLLHQDYEHPCAVNSHLNLPLSPRDSTTSSATPFISHASLNNRILLIRMSVLILAGIIHFWVRQTYSTQIWIVSLGTVKDRSTHQFSPEWSMGYEEFLS